MKLHTPFTTRPASLLPPARPTMSPARALRLLRLRSVYRHLRASLGERFTPRGYLAPVTAREAYGNARQAVA